MTSSHAGAVLYLPLLLAIAVLLSCAEQEAGNGHSDESRAWNGTSDVDRESVLSMTMESEASNVAVKVRDKKRCSASGGGGVRTLVSVVSYPGATGL